MISRLTLLVLLLPAGGCFFSERSLPLNPVDRVAAAPPAAAAPMTTRQWLVAAQPQLQRLLPHHPKKPMLTDEMVRPDGKPGRGRQNLKDRKKNALHGFYSGFFALCISAGKTSGDVGNDSRQAASLNA